MTLEPTATSSFAASGPTTSAPAATTSADTSISGPRAAASSLPSQDDGRVLDAASLTGPYMKFWHLLLGTTDIVGNEIVHEELARRCDCIISGLMFYDAPNLQIPTLPESASTKEKLKVEIMKALSVQESVAVELLCLFLAFEYKGVVSSLTELLPTNTAIKKFVGEISDFYKRERLCLLYSAQVILNHAADSDHRFAPLFSSFIAAASMVDWVKWMCLSLDKVETDEEHLEVLHTLTILVFYYGHFPRVLSTFNTYFKFGRKSGSKRGILVAESVLLFSLLQSGTSQEDTDIKEFLLTHLKQLDENPYFFGAIVSAYAKRCEGDVRIRNVVQQTPNPEKCVHNIAHVLKEYNGSSYKNKHGLGSILYKSVYNAVETILVNFERDNFGTLEDWNELLNLLLRDRSTAHTFMVEQPEELTILYTGALSSFPVQIHWGLSFWASLCRTATPEVPALCILEKITEINGLCDEVSELDTGLIRPNGNEEWVLLGEKIIGGLSVKPGTIGRTLQEENPLLIGWEFDAPAQNITIWEVLFNSIISPAYSEYPDFKPATIRKIIAIAKFLSEFSQTSKEAPATLLRLFPPVIRILQSLLSDTLDSEKKSELISLLLDVTRGGCVYNVDILLNSDGLWPTPSSNYVTDIILSYESVMNTQYTTTKTFLRNVIELFGGGEEEDPYHLKETLFPPPLQLVGAPILTIYTHALDFILENIYPSFVRWRSNSSPDQFIIIRDTFRILIQLFALPNHSFLLPLKDRACRGILGPGNSLLAVLSIDGDKIRDAWILPSKATQFLDQTLFYALTLLTHLGNFDIRTLKLLDSSSNLSLVKKLGSLVRHRLNPTLPTLAISILQKIGLEVDISLLACFGSGIDSFRDLLLQRLDFKSEAVQLKVAILGFLTVCAQTQPGLIQHLFEETSFTSCLLDLLSEAESNLGISALSLIRALFRKGNTLFKDHDAWSDIIKPINSLQKFNTLLAKQKIISYTMHIFAFEIHRSSLLEKEFSAALTQVLTDQNILTFVKVALDKTKTAETKKSIHALKHFLTLLLSRPDSETIISDASREICLAGVTDEFWRYTEEEDNGDMLPGIVELMLVLGPSSDSAYLEKLSAGLPQVFKASNLLVQLPLLTLIYKSLPTVTSEISSATIENLVLLVSHVFFHAATIYNSLCMELVRSLLSVAASTMYAIILSPYCKNWAPIFRRRMILNSILSVAHVGLVKGEAPEVIEDCIGCLIRLAQIPEIAELLRNTSLTTELYLPLTQFSRLDAANEKWSEVVMLATELNAGMLETEKIYFLEESLNFWTYHGGWLGLKLSSLTDLINHSYLQSPDQNFNTIKSLLSYCSVILHGMGAMAPYFQQWRLQHHMTLKKLMEGVLGTLETSVSLLSQPNHLLLVITKPNKTHGPTSPAFKLTPQLLDIQTKLWEVVGNAIELYLRIGPHEKEFVQSEELLPLLYKVIGLCGRVMSKHGDKKSSPVVNVTADVSMSLEKGLVLLLAHITQLSREYAGSGDKEKSIFLRETTTEITSLCDMVRRLGLPPADFSIAIVGAVEETIREMLCK